MKKKLIKFITHNWLVIVLAIIPPFLIYYYFQRDTKEIGITINSHTSVIELNEQYSDEIKILYKNKPIKTLEVLHISVENLGTQPIIATDFSSPLTFAFESKTQIPLNSIQSYPKYLNPKLTGIEDSLYTLEPLLLNPKDKFTFLAFVIDSKNPIQPLEIKARIVGISEPTLDFASNYGTENNSSKWIEILAVILGASISLLSSINLVRRLKEITFTITKSGQIGIKLSEISDKKEIKSLAHRLKIEGHDTKSNLLLIRIKIEEQLRELASNLDLPEKNRLKSPYLLSKSLEDQHILERIQGNSIREILKIINRELHISESYLSHRDYQDLQVQSLQLLDVLISLNETTAKKEV